MDWAKILTTALDALVPVILTVIGALIVRFLQKKGANENTIALVKEGYTLVTKAVGFVNQTYTSEIKESGLKLSEAQKAEARSRCMEQFNILASDAIKLAIESIYTSTDKWLDTILEADVWDAKKDATEE